MCPPLLWRNFLDYKASDVILAREVRKGSQTLALRDAEGRPQWAADRESGRSGRYPNR